MPCPVHAHVDSSRQTHKDITPREERLVSEKMDRLAELLGGWHDDILATLENGTVDLRRGSAIRRALENTLDNHREEIDVTFEGAWKDGHDMGREMAIQSYDLGISFEVTRPEVERALRENSFVASKATKQRMVGDLGDALAEAYNEGLSIPDITSRLQDGVFEDMQGYEAERIARTETISGSNKGGVEAFRDSSAVGHEWLAANDRRTRPSHSEASGQVVSMEGRFVVGGSRAKYPGDPMLPTRERVNCRCTTAPVFDPDLLSS